MNGGDTNLGGPQVTPGSSTPPTSGSRPIISGTPASSDPSDLSIPHGDKSPRQPLTIKVSSPAPQPTQPSSITPSPSATSTQDTPVAPANKPTINTTSQPSESLGAQSSLNTEAFAAPVANTPYGNDIPAQSQIYAAPSYNVEDAGGQEEEFIALAGAAPQTKNSNKKRWILGGVLGALAAIGVAVGVTIAFSGNSAVNDTKSLLNIYSNYLLFGVESVEPIPDNLDVWNADNIELQLANENITEKEAYFSKLVELYGEFKDSYEKNNKLKEEIGEENLDYSNILVSSTMTALSTLKEYSVIPKISENEMVALYFDNGAANMISQITETYSYFAASDNSAKSDYGNGKIGLADAIKSLYSQYKEANCLDGKTIVQECPMNDEEYQKTILYQNNIKNYTSIIDNAIWHINNDTISLSNMVYMALVQGYGQGEFENG